MEPGQDARRDWRRLFGLVLTDFFTDSPFTVETWHKLRFSAPPSAR